MRYASHWSHRSRGAGRSPTPFSVSASPWSDAADPPASSGIGTGTRCSSATRCASLAGVGDCVVYAQDPLAARAALRARRGPHQRVVMAVHFRISQADEWADKEQITRDGTVFREIRKAEREVIPKVDGLVYVSKWAQDAL